MKNFKKIVSLMVVTVALSISSLAANAESIGVIDVSVISAKYNRAQELASNMKVQEADVQKKIADAQKKIKIAKSPVEQRNLEKKYKEEIDKSIDKIKDKNAKEIEAIDNDLTKAITTVSKQKNLGIILNKQAVVQGGVDITDEVLAILNK